MLDFIKYHLLHMCGKFYFLFVFYIDALIFSVLFSIGLNPQYYWDSYILLPL